MTQTPAGWYPDPDPASAAQPGRLRYWDGTGWTEHVNEPAVTATQPAPVPSAFAQQPTGYYAPAAYQDYGANTYYEASNRDTTPDGVPLAGWWWRVLALFLDGLIQLPFAALLAAPVVALQWDSWSRWFDDMQYASDTGTADPPVPGALWAALGMFFLASLLYQFLFLLWKQATPGKLIVGLRVRLRQRPELPVGAILLRMLGVFLLGLCWIGQVLDYLWPLWDDKKQALHDKMAKTNVVKIR